MAFSTGIRRLLLGGSSTASPAIFRHESTLPTPPLTTTKLFVSGLYRHTTSESLRKAFLPFGNLLEATVVTDRVSGMSKCFGFVRYETLEEAERAREGMNAKFLDGWVIFVDPAKPPQPKPRPPPERESSDSGFKSFKTVGWCG